MRPVYVHARAGVPPRRVEDLVGGHGAPLHRDWLVAAGQALTWQSAFTRGPLSAIPLTGTSAVIFRHHGEPGLGGWHARFARGLAHRMAGELTIASVAAGLLNGDRSGDGPAEDAELLGSALEGLSRLLIDLDEARALESAEEILADAVRTHTALLDGIIAQRVSAHAQGDFTVHTVRSICEGVSRDELERVRTRVGLPWPTREGNRNGVGGELGLARWLTAVQLHGHQMWGRLEGENSLVTELWLRRPPARRE
jgi:hypothetical protein